MTSTPVSSQTLFLSSSIQSSRWDEASLVDIQLVKQIMEQESVACGFDRTVLMDRPKFSQAAQTWKRWMIESLQATCERPSLNKSSAIRAKVFMLIQQDQHKQLFRSMINLVLFDIDSAAIQLVALRMLRSVSSFARQPSHFCFLIRTFKQIESLVNMSDETSVSLALDPVLVEYMDALIESWRKIREYDSDWNPVERFLKGNIDIGHLEMCAQLACLRQLQGITCEWRIMVMKRILLVCSLDNARFIVDNIPDHSRHVLTQAIQARQIIESESIPLGEPLPMVRLASAHAKTCRIRRIKQLHTARGLKRNRDESEEYSCPVCMEDKELQILYCGHSMCHACLQTMSSTRASRLCMCPVCKQTSIPLYVEHVDMTSKIARLDVIDTSDKKIGTIEMQESDKVLHSSQMFSMRFYPQFECVRIPAKSRIVIMDKLEDAPIASTPSPVQWFSESRE